VPSANGTEIIDPPALVNAIYTLYLESPGCWIALVSAFEPVATDAVAVVVVHPLATVEPFGFESARDIAQDAGDLFGWRSERGVVDFEFEFHLARLASATPRRCAGNHRSMSQGSSD
jgi:hypothetical protein